MDGGSAQRRVIAVVAGRLVVARDGKGGAEGVYGLALEAESHMGVDGGGDADVGVAEEFLDHDEFEPCSRSRVAVECLRSWKRMRRRPALRRSVVKVRVRLVGSGVDEMVLWSATRGPAQGEVSAHLAEVYGAGVSKATISPRSPTKWSTV